MKITKSCFLLILISLVFTFNSSAQVADSPDLLGEWVNVDPATRGITGVVIAPGRSGLAIQAWGRCHPRDCEWGETPLHLVANSVDDRAYKGAFAVWNAGFATKYVTVTRCKDQLVAVVMTIFKDGSNRSNFRSVQFFRRSDAAMPE